MCVCVCDMCNASTITKPKVTQRNNIGYSQALDRGMVFVVASIKYEECTEHLPLRIESNGRRAEKQYEALKVCARIHRREAK